jgi:NAD(P)-dependent dehydrogenase (short-subunit alcohol dehydrogenase family)
MVDLLRFSLEGKVALVTGGSRGIGEATAVGFAEAGADIILASRKIADLEKVAGKIKSKGRKCLPVAAHLGRMEEIDKLVDTAKKEFGKIDILVNNAGTSPSKANPLDAEERLWDSIMNLNLKGLYFLSQRVGRIMKEHGGGKIINVASVDGYHPQPDLSIYAISKAGVIIATRSMAQDLGKYNIRVNCIAPGSIMTQMLKSLFEYTPGLEEEGKKRISLGRIGQPDEIVGMMIYLASEASSYVTGHTFIIDGGLIKSV